MILHMIDNQGRTRIGRFVRDEIARQGSDQREVGARPGRPGFPTIKRIVAGDPNVSELMLLALGGKLGLPANYLIYVGTGDIRRIKKSGASPDLIQVTIDLIEPEELNADYNHA
jgi:ABC-type Fe3+-hydroxamate transport system substrate-binding protein